jgi:hypothetical protein
LNNNNNSTPLATISSFFVYWLVQCLTNIQSKEPLVKKSALSLNKTQLGDREEEERPNDTVINNKEEVIKQQQQKKKTNNNNIRSVGTIDAI